MIETTLQNIRQCHGGRVVEAQLVTVIVPAGAAAGGKPAKIITPVYFWLGNLRTIFLSAKGWSGQSLDAAGRDAVRDQIHELLAIAATNHLPRIGVRDMEVPSRAQMLATASLPRVLEVLEANGAMKRVTL